MTERARAAQAMVLTELGSGGVLTVDELLIRLPQLTFGELFLALDTLSRRGEVQMRRRGFDYEVSIASSPLNTGTQAS